MAMSLDAMPVALTSGNWAWVSPEDHAASGQFRWYELGRRSGRTTYAAASLPTENGVRPPNILLHRWVAGRAGIAGSQIDHRSRAGLDCTRGNLRSATGIENRRNEGVRRGSKSGFKGVSLHRQASGKTSWVARIKLADRQLSLGLHKTPEEAARAYDQAARQHFGEFAYLNFPDGGGS